MFARLKKRYKSRSRASQSATPRIQTDSFASNIGIVPKKIQDSTHPTSFLSQFPNHGKLISLIEQKRFTDCLEHLERLGCTGDAAILVLANLQALGGVA